MKTINFYVIDSSSLIELNLRYPIDVFPNLWKSMEDLIDKGLMVSPNEVLKEISVKDDALKEWARSNKKMFRQLNEFQMLKVKEILSKYPSLAKSDNEFPAADPFLIALAIELEDNAERQKTLVPAIKKNIIVTEEKARGEQVRIPFVCRDYDIDCINVIELFRQEQWKF